MLTVVAAALSTTADVVSADCIDDARRALVTDHIDLVVLDISLGMSSGLDLLPDLRDNCGNVIPVIILSAQDAGLACDEQIQVALAKSGPSLETLVAAVRYRLALLPACNATEAA
jgi:DNA-binding response OmpR family regulator